MSSLSHVNIVQYRGAEVNRPACELMIFQEWCATTAKHSSPRAESGWPVPHDDSLVPDLAPSAVCAGRERARACVRRVPGGSLSAVLEQFGGSFEAPLIRRYLLHLLRGLEYLHSHMIVHRDIKGENVLVSEDGIAKLGERPGDFLVFLLHLLGPRSLGQDN